MANIIGINTPYRRATFEPLSSGKQSYFDLVQKGDSTFTGRDYKGNLINVTLNGPSSSVEGTDLTDGYNLHFSPEDVNKVAKATRESLKTEPMSDLQRVVYPVKKVWNYLSSFVK